MLAGPVFGVDAGIDDEAAGAPEFVGEAAEVVVGVLVEATVWGGGGECAAGGVAHFEAEAFGVEGPALDEGGDADGGAEGVLVAGFGEFLGDGDLEVVAGDGLVHGETGFGEGGADAEVAGVDHEVAGDTGASGAGVVVGGGAEACGEGGDFADAVGVAREEREEGGEFGVDSFAEVAVVGHHGLGGGPAEAFVGADGGEEGLEEVVVGCGCRWGRRGRCEAGFADGCDHLGFERGDLLEAEGVDLVGGEVGGGVVAEAEVVVVGAVDALAGADGFAAGGEVFGFDEGGEGLEGGGDAVFDGGEGAGGEWVLRW